MSGQSAATATSAVAAPTRYSVAGAGFARDRMLCRAIQIHAPAVAMIARPVNQLDRRASRANTLPNPAQDGNGAEEYPQIADRRCIEEVVLTPKISALRLNGVRRSPKRKAESPAGLVPPAASPQGGGKKVRSL